MSTTAGIDLGSDSIKGVVLRARKTGPVEVIGAGTMPIADLTRLPEGQDRALAIGEKLRELVRSARLRADTRRVGASGGRTSIRYLQIPPVPPWRLEMLVKYEVEERAEEKEPNCSDYHIMDVPEANGQYTVAIGMCREGYADELLSQAKAGGLGEVEIDLEALALYASYYHGHGFDADKTVAIADIGADDITVLVCRNGALYYARTMLGGGRRFTQNLADDLKLEWHEAEDLKKTTAEISFEVQPAPGASGVARTRIQRPGGTLSIPRASMPPRPGASAAIPGVGAADSGALPPAAARSGIQPIPGASGVRGTDGAKLPARLNAAGPAASGVAGSQVKPGVAPSASKAQPAAPAEPAPKPAAPSIKLAAETEFNDKFLEEFELDVPASSSAPAPVPMAPVAPVAPVAAAPVAPPPPPAPPKAEVLAMDDFELQPSVEEKKGPPAKPAPKAPPPPVQAAAPSTTASSGDIVDLLPVGEATKSPGIGASSLETADGFPTAIVAPEDKDKRKRQITAALVREAASICAAIENVVSNAKQQAKQPQMKIDRLYICGGGCKLKGLSEFMGRRLRVEVAPLEPLRNLSLDRLSPYAAEALKAEQHTLGVALGLALSDLRQGAFNFMLLPQRIKDRKEFWARGAYHYYAAGAAAVALAFWVATPYFNTDALSHNFQVADDAFKVAKLQNEDVKKREKENDELRHRVKAITDNVQSGNYFLDLLAELKSKKRIQDDIYLCAVSTSIPQVVMAESDPGSKVDSKLADLSKEPDSFTAQRRVYLRGFARAKRPDILIEPIQIFYNNLVPHPENPDDPSNVFKDIRLLWASKEDNVKDGYYLKEFVLEAYTAVAAKDPAKVETNPKNKKGEKGEKGAPINGAKGANTAKPAQPIQPVQPAQAVPVPVPAQPVVVPAQPIPVPMPAQPVVVPAQPIPLPAPAQPVVVPAQPIPAPVPVPAQPVVVPAQPIPVPLPAQPVVVPAQPIPVPAQPVVVPAQPVPAPVQPAQAVQPALPAQPVAPVVPAPKKNKLYVMPDETPVAPDKTPKEPKP